jgi:hypothetical protein
MGGMGAACTLIYTGPLLEVDLFSVHFDKLCFKILDSSVSRS